MATRERFDELVVEAVDALPAWVRERLDNVEILVEDGSPPGRAGLLGLYEGIPLTQRGSNYFGVLPDRITLFRSNLERLAADEAALRSLVRHTVVHEVAHFFGISDERLVEMDRY
jgi:predicted Zn-dependent protease with MMP-like domain